MGGASDMHEEEEKWIEGFGGEIWKKETTLKTQDLMVL
jgi:hypothetical protein